MMSGPRAAAAVLLIADVVILAAAACAWLGPRAARPDAWSWGLLLAGLLVTRILLDVSRVGWPPRSA